jgi:hypothetical protein
MAFTFNFSIHHIQFPLLFLNLLFLYSARFNCSDSSAVVLIIRSPSKHVIETLPADSPVVHVSHSVCDPFNYKRYNWRNHKHKQKQMVGVVYLKYTSPLKNLSNSRPSKTAGSFPRNGTLPVSHCAVQMLLTNLITTDTAERAYLTYVNFLSAFRVLSRTQYKIPKHIIILTRFPNPLSNRGVLLSTLIQDILNCSHHLLNVLLQIANKLGLSAKRNLIPYSFQYVR